MNWMTALSFAGVVSVTGVASAQQQQQQVYIPQQPVYTQPQPVYVQPIYAQPNTPRQPKVIHDWSEGEPIPPGYHPSTRVRMGLAGAGGGILLGSYLLTALGGAAALQTDKNESTHVSDWVLFLPVAGPFIRAVGNDSLSATLLVFDGLIQIGGAAMLIGGLASSKTVLVRDDFAKRKILPMPMVIGSGGGAGVVGRF